jgi:outer membrane biosynthesis protein TonB
MRLSLVLLAGLLVVVDFARSQSVDTTTTNRPALVGSGPQALVNKIDVAELFTKGQKDGAVMFACIVDAKGDVSWNATYRPTPNSQLLEREVLKQLPGAKFVPAIHDGKLVDVVFFGTVFYSVAEGKPHLRVFANQETEELKKESDFIAPQPYFGGNSKFFGLHYPTQNTPVMVTAAVEFTITVDGSGNLKNIELVSEYPPLLGFGESAMDDFRLAKFIPGHRNGKPVESKVTLTVYFQPPEA